MNFSLSIFFLLLLVIFNIFSNKSLLTQRSWTFSPRNFIVVRFTFRSKFYFGVNCCSSAHLCYPIPYWLLLRFTSINNTDDTLSHMAPCGYMEKYLWLVRHIFNSLSVCKLLSTMVAEVYTPISMVGESLFPLFLLLMNNYKIFSFTSKLRFYIMLFSACFLMTICDSFLIHLLWSFVKGRGNQYSYPVQIVSELWVHRLRGKALGSVPLVQCIGVMIGVLSTWPLFYLLFHSHLWFLFFMMLN